MNKYCNSRCWWCAPCWMLIGLALLWAALSTLWYVCAIKKVCGQTQVQPAPIAAPADVVKDTPSATWNELVMKPLTLYFVANSDKVLTADVENKLKDIVAYMQANPTVKILLTGHTNAHKSQAFTNQLGLDRANKVRDLLIGLGAPSAQIVIESKGQTQLAGSPATAEGRYLNRRVVVSVVQ